MIEEVGLVVVREKDDPEPKGQALMADCLGPDLHRDDFVRTKWLRWGVARLWNNWLTRKSRPELVDAGSAVLEGAADGMPGHLVGEPRHDQGQRPAGDSSEVDTGRKREEP